MLTTNTAIKEFSNLEDEKEIPSKINILFQPFSNFIKLSAFSMKLIKKCCGGERLIDLLLHFPISISKRVGNINDFSEKDKLTLVLKILEHKAVRFKKSAPYKIIASMNDGTLVTIIYFNYNPGFLRKTFPIGTTLTVSGNANITLEGIEIIHPDVVTKPEFAKYYIGTEAVYPLTARLTNRTISFAIKSALKILPEISEWMPQNILTENNFLNFSETIRRIHDPKSELDLSVNNIDRKRIAIDELLANQIRLFQLRENLKQHKALNLKINGNLLNKLHLPFELTDDQKRCLEDIKKDLTSGKPMNRLIQGDVGSGKTVVSFLSMLIALENGMQAALLAPTEILAIQHYNNILDMSHELGINIDIMLSANRKIRNRQIDNLRVGLTQILIGTHAILEDNIEFEKLGLIVIDEQHRFGVLQRQKLIEKCNYPNVLTMSATPIPRTLLLGCYGDLDVSTIKTKPAGRKPIKTVAMNVDKINELIKSMSEVNSQIYWVCPAIEESETLVDVNSRYNYLCQHFSENDVRILHGKMKPWEKDEIIHSFKREEFKILVSTTVIEVGIDIPTANIIIIEHAERFGLAQLHQLRGRVGRGLSDAFCILLYHTPLSKIARQRLELLKNTNDGFVLSEEDLKLRGAGDILGCQQSGFNILRFSDFSENEQLLKIANNIAQQIDIHDEKSQMLCDIFNRLNQDIVA